MRIGVATWSSRQAGGIETYLRHVCGALVDRGHEVSLFCEVDAPTDREPIPLPAGVTRWCASADGLSGALVKLQGWQPERIFSHGLHDPATEAAAQQLAPAVLLAHAYHGACISGSKTHRFPTAQPCQLDFGGQCLLQYFPRRCGGLNPLTMLHAYSVQRRRQRLLDGYRAIVTLSRHMRDEMARCAQKETPVYHVPGFLPEEPPAVTGDTDRRVDIRQGPLSLLFLGRLEYLKGGQLLLDALPIVRQTLGRPLQVTIGGDGPEYQRWMRKAEAIQRTFLDVHVTFPGWVASTNKAQLWRAHHLLVMPSIWPEPFGLVGLEAGAWGVPAAAFAVGGIPDWLKPGVNGCLAAADPPTATKLARAVTTCLQDPAHYDSLCQGARQQAAQFSLTRHVDGLLDIFAQVTRTTAT